MFHLCTKKEIVTQEMIIATWLCVRRLWLYLNTQSSILVKSSRIYMVATLH